MDLHKVIESSLKEYKITGASVSIVSNSTDPVIYNYGYANKSLKAFVENPTIFRIGSMTKIFTATAIMQLAEQGKVDIEKTIQDYIPEFSIKTRFGDLPITVRDILCHHAGLPCDNLVSYFTNDLTAFHSVVPYLKNSYMVAPPGRQFYYSNVGYELLGVVISRIAGEPFHEYIEKTIFQPLGMNSSAISLPRERFKYFSKPYKHGREQIERPMKTIPEGGIYSTTTDMAKFMHSILNRGSGLFRNNRMLDTMLIPQYPENPFDMNMVNGLGWFIGKPGLDYAGKVIWHDGGTPNFFSIMVLIPERKLGITILNNSATGAIPNHRLSVEILQRLVEDKFSIPASKNEPKAKGIYAKSDIPIGTIRFFTLSGMAQIKRSKSSIVAKLSAGKVQLLPHADGWFGLKILLFGIVPLHLKITSMLRLGLLRIGKENILALEQLGFRSTFGKEWRKLKVHEKWLSRIGKYSCPNEETPRLKEFQLIVDKNGLRLFARTDKMGILNIYLDTINESEAITLGYGRFAGETISAINDEITAFGLTFKIGRKNTPPKRKKGIKD